MLVTSDICCVSCLRMGNDNICQHVDFFHPLADFVIDVFFFYSLPFQSLLPDVVYLQWIFEYLFLQIA